MKVCAEKNFCSDQLSNDKPESLRYPLIELALGLKR